MTRIDTSTAQPFPDYDGAAPDAGNPLPADAASRLRSAEAELQRLRDREQAARREAGACRRLAERAGREVTGLLASSASVTTGWTIDPGGDGSATVPHWSVDVMLPSRRIFGGAGGSPEMAMEDLLRKLRA